MPDVLAVARLRGTDARDGAVGAPMRGGNVTDMEHAIEKAAKVIRSAIEQQADVVADGMHLDVQGVLTPHWIAEALATNGLLAPAPLREEWAAAWEGLGATRIGSVQESLDDIEGIPPGGWVVRRYVSDWEPVDRAEGDGKADQ